MKNPLTILIAGGLSLIGLIGLVRSSESKGGTHIVKTPNRDDSEPSRLGRVGTDNEFSTLDELYQFMGRKHAVDWRLLKAIAIVESSENPNAINPSDPSYGLMQVLCTGIEEGGNRTCTNKLNLPDWPPTVDQLMDVETNLDFGAGILAWNIQTYGMLKGIAVYNRWASRLDPNQGPFGNQGYVDKVLMRYPNVRPSSQTQVMV